MTCSTLNELPPELLSLILERACTLKDPVASTKQPHVLCKVSKHWQAIVKTSPGIWSIIHVSEEATPEGVSQAVELSGALPLEITFDHPLATEDAWHGYLKLLTPHADRWSSLKLAHADITEAHVHNLPSSLPNLLSLELRSLQKFAQPEDAARLVFDSAMPSLQTLRLDGLSAQWECLSLPELRELEITKCHLSAADAFQFMDMLETCPKLVRLILSDVATTRPFVSPRRVTLPTLEEFVLKDVHSHEVLEWIIAPNLRKLTVGKTFMWYSRWRALELDYPNLEEATIVNLSNSTAALRNLLNAMPNIHKLNIATSDFTDPYSFAADLVLQQGSWPNLKELTIHGVFSLGQLRKVVEAHKTCLTQLRIHCCDLGLIEGSMKIEYDEHEEALAWLEQAVDFGVEHAQMVHGPRFRTHEDQKWGKQMICEGA